MSCQATPTQSTPLASRITDTPMSKKQSGFEQYSSTSTTRDQRFEHMASEISKYVVGPMPVSDFLERFLRPPKTPPKKHKGEVPSDPNKSPKPKVPSDMIKGLEAYVASTADTKYKALVDALQPICSNFEFTDTNLKRIGTFQGHKIAPDICVVERDTANVPITEVEIMMEFRPNNIDDPFADESKEYFVNITTSGLKTLGQITLYAAAHQAAQFRTHVFSVLVFSAHVRLLRWDRSGVIVTKALPIISEEFIEFFQLYDQATPATRGIDTSVTTPLKNTSIARKSLRVGPDLPLVQLTVGPLLNKVYIVSRDTYMNNAHSPLGRSTRTFIAYSTFDKCNVFLKDSWRLDSQTPEHEIYTELQLKEVPHIPTVLDGSDILDQTTLTQDVKSKLDQKIATPLSSFRSTKILVRAVHDAIQAHRAAYFDAHILHRDISSGNIMIYNNGGLLIDWDLSKNTEDKGARETERTGTWQFAACRLLLDPTVVQDLTDDVESFIHVLTWISFRFAKHDVPDEKVRAFLALVFDFVWTGEDGLAKGGDTKKDYLTSHSLLQNAEFEEPILKKLLLRITDTIARRYRPFLKDADGDVVNYNDLSDMEGLGTLDSGAFISILASMRQKKYEDDLKILEDSEWIIGEFASVLDNWPASEDENTQTAQFTTHTDDHPSSLKRKNSEDAGGKGKKPRR